ncbi:MAG TPA: hypothetical protein VNA57_06925 [Acidimicrobiales bacterium]|nr:hypothetical protein [Acidimicrobiales bacterium]
MRRTWLAVFLVVLAAGQLAVGMRASRTASVTGDEPFYLLTAQSLASDGDLDLRDEYRNNEERKFWDGSVPLWRQMEPTDDGRLLSPHDPGLSLLILPAYALGGLRGAQRFLVVLWAGAMAFAAVLARRAGAPNWAAAVAGVVVGAGTPGVVYASQVYPEGPAALCVAIGLLLATAPPEKARPHAFLLATALVALAWLGVKYAPFAVLIAATWAWRFRTERRALTIAAALTAVAALHFAWWHLHTFGGLTPYSTNVVYSGEGTASIVDQHVTFTGRGYRLYGLFIDARFGLIRWLPATLLAAWGLRRSTILHGTVIGIGMLMGTFVSITMMGWWFPGRMLIATLPALVVLIAKGAQRLPKTAITLSAWSLAIAVALVVAARTGEVRLAVDPWRVGIPLPPSSLFPDFRSFGIRQMLLSLAWAAALAGAVWWSRRGPGGWRVGDFEVDYLRSTAQSQSRGRDVSRTGK